MTADYNEDRGTIMQQASNGVDCRVAAKGFMVQEESATWCLGRVAAFWSDCGDYQAVAMMTQHTSPSYPE
jgi:hypothetical protein